MPAHLFIRSGPNGGEVHALGGEPAVVGRGVDCTVCLADRHASRQHFRVEPRGGAYWVVDLGSKNGTSLNGLPVSEKKLTWGDEIRVGATRLVFFEGREAAVPLATDTVAGRLTRTFSAGERQFDMIGASPAMRAVYAVIEKAAPLDVTVLVTGESGTGKELVARALHAGGPRAEEPLVAVNCAAIPRELVESELFGHEKGAFTGASVQRRGRFELARGGTLFLDEIGELTPESQAKLLRVIDEKQVTRVGAEKAIPVDVRLVAATNRDLRALVSAGKFREDLLFRLEVVRINVPPLRDRAGDIPELARFYAERFGREAGRRGVELSAEAVTKLTGYAWPGNVRELKNVVERAVIMAASPRLGADDIQLPEAAGAAAAGGFEPLAAVEKRHIERAMALAGGKKSRAAELLGIPRSSLYDKLREHGFG